MSFPCATLIACPRSVPSSWVQGAVCFPAGISKKRKLASLQSIPGLDETLAAAVLKHTDVWFPVQKAVLPILLRASRSHVLPPRDLVGAFALVLKRALQVLSAPTGSGKTLAFVIPILNALRTVERNASSVFALVVAPVQSLAVQIEAVRTLRAKAHARPSGVPQVQRVRGDRRPAARRQRLREGAAAAVPRGKRRRQPGTRRRR